MSTHRPITGQVLFSVALLQGLAMSAPASANEMHRAFGTPAQNVSQSTPSAYASQASSAAASTLPAAFGHGVTHLPLATQTLPLTPQAASFNPAAFGRQLHDLPATTLPSSQNVQLDMTSAASLVTLGADAIKNGGSVTVDLGGAATTFHVGDKVTAAELVAIQQAQTWGGQSLALNGSGVAVGGTFSLSRVTAPSADVSVTGVVVPSNVTAIDKLVSPAFVNFTGDLINYGSIVQTSGFNTSANLSAHDIVNAAGGSISTVAQGGKTVDLNLTAANQIVNSGTISSAGALSLNAPTITNSGTITATAGDITLSAGPSVDLNVNNAGGSVSASGAINIREAGYVGTGASNIVGGDWFSQQFNIHSGKALAEVNVNQLTGSVVSDGEAVHVKANTDMLVLGKQCLTGDPTYWNGSGGITINDNIVVAEDLAIISSGSITATGKMTLISAPGANITIIAGVSIASAGGTSSPNLPPFVNDGTITINMSSSGKGGKVDFSNAAPGLLINSSATGSGNGGNITIAAFEGYDSFGPVAGTGTVLLPSGSAVKASGAGAGQNGDVMILARTPLAITAINVGQISSARNITVANTGLTSSDGQFVTFESNGSISSGNSLIVSNNGYANFGDVNVNGSLSASGTINIFAGGTANLNAFVQSSSTTTVSSNGAINLGSGISGNAGIVLVAGGDVNATTNTISLFTAPSVAGTGNVIVSAGSAFLTQPDGSIQMNGTTDAGGNVAFSKVANIGTVSNVSGVNGGSVSIGAARGVNGTGGKIDVSQTVVTVSGKGAGASGDIVLTAGLTGGDAILMPTKADFSNGSPGTGNLVVRTSAPVESNTNINPVTATFSSGGLGGDSFTTAGNINLGTSNSVIINGGKLNYTAGGKIIAGSSVFVSGNFSSATLIGASIILPAFLSGSAGFLTVSSTGNITATGPISVAKVGMFSTGGDIAVASITAPQSVVLAANGSVTASQAISTTSAGNAGAVTIISGAVLGSYDINAVAVTSAAKGYITLHSIDASSTGGNGGNVTISAFDADGSAATIAFTNTAGIKANGGSSFTSGNVLINSASGVEAFSKTSVLSVFVANSKNSGSITLGNTSNDFSFGPIVFDVGTGNVQGSIISSNSAGGTSTFGSLGAGSAITIKGGTISLNGPANVNAGPLLVLASGDITVGNVSPSAKSISLASHGSILTSAPLLAINGLSLVAGKDIKTMQSGLSIGTYGGASSGNLTMIAGAAFTADDTLVTITGPALNATGGIIDLKTSGVANLKTDAANGAGAITMVAFSGTGGQGGQILLPDGLTVSSRASTSGNNGDVTMVAGGTNGSVIVGQFTVDTTGATAGTGNVNLVAATPNTSTPITVNRNTGLVSGSLLGGAATTGSVVEFKAIQTSKATVRIQQGADLTNPATSPVAASLILQSDGMIKVSSALTNNSVALFAGGNIQIQANILAPGGIALVAGGDITSTVAGVKIQTDSATTDAGDLTIISGASFAYDANGLTITGPSGTGGKISLPLLANISASSTAISGIGGKIGLASYKGSSNDASITLPTAGVLSSTSLSDYGRNISVIGDSDSTISLGGVTTLGGVVLLANGPLSSVSVANNGVVTGSFSPSTLTAGTIKAGTITTTGGAINVTTAGLVQVTIADSSSAAGFGGAVTVTSGSTTNTLEMGTTTGFNYVGAINTSGNFSTGSAGSLDIESTGGSGLTFTDASKIVFAGSNLSFAPQLKFIATGATLDLGTFQGGNINVSSATGAAGKVTISADNLAYASSKTGPLTITANGLMSPGRIAITLNGTSPQTIGNVNGGLVLTSKGGNISFYTPNATLSVDGSAIDVVPSGPGNGGTIDLQANGFTSAKPIVLDASATTGAGGKIFLADLSTNPLVIGGGNGQFALKATGSNQGGYLAIFGQSLVVDPSKISVAPTASNATGATINLTSNTTLVVNGALSADGGPSGTGGQISLFVNSPTTFTTGATGKIVNGVGGLSAGGGTGGSISITNQGGSIINAGAITNFAKFTETVVGAKSVITINNTLGKDNTSEIHLFSDAGNISSTKDIKTGSFEAVSKTGAISFTKLNATTIVATTGTTKTSNVAITSLGTLPVGIAQISGNNITFKAAGSIGGSGDVTGSGTVSVSSTAKTGATIDLDDIISTGSTVTIATTGNTTLGSVSGLKGIKITTKDAASGIHLTDNVGSTAGTVVLSAPAFVTFDASVDLSANKGATLTAPKGSITIGTVGVAGATSALTATGFTSVKTVGSVTAANTITLKATDKIMGSGFVSVGGPLTVSSTKGTLTLTAGALGTVDDGASKDGTAMSAGKIVVTAPGGATFNHDKLSATGTTIAITAAKGDITLASVTGLTATTTVTLTPLNKLTAAGTITGPTGVTISAKGADGKSGAFVFDGSISATKAASKVTITATGGMLVNGAITAEGDVTLKTGIVSGAVGSTINSNGTKVVFTTASKMYYPGSITAKTNITVSTTAKDKTNFLTIGNLKTSEGNISVIGTGGILNTVSGATIYAGSTLSKTKATILFENSNTTDGTISIDGSLETRGPGGGNVSISIGAPGTGKNPYPATPLANFNVTNTGGTVFAGATPSALLVTGVGQTSLTTIGKNIILQSPNAARTITFTSTSSVVADPPVGGLTLSPVASPVRIMPVSSSLSSDSVQTFAPASSDRVTVNSVPIAYNAIDLNSSIANTRSAYRWISNTELDGGAIPAVFVGHVDMGLADNEAATSRGGIVRNSDELATMQSGTALVSPQKDMTIETPHGKVFIAARSLAVVMALPNGLAVYNLHDKKGHSVGIERGGKRLHIAPASVAVFVNDNRASFASVNPAQLVCYGPLNETMHDGGKVFTAEISLPTAIGAMPMLKAMIASKDKEASKIATDFLKTVSIMYQLSGTKYSTFRQHIKPLLTASR